MTKVNRKYEFTGETEVYCGRILHRIRAITDIVGIGICDGDLGGWIEKEDNLSAYGNAWVGGNAWVFGTTRVFGNAWVSGVNLTATRSDGYTFLVAPTPDGPRIIAGCRYFDFDQAEKHWTETRGNTPLGEESLAIVAHLKRMAEIKGFRKPVEGADK